MLLLMIFFINVTEFELQIYIYCRLTYTAKVIRLAAMYDNEVGVALLRERDQTCLKGQFRSYQHIQYDIVTSHYRIVEYYCSTFNPIPRYSCDPFTYWSCSLSTCLLREVTQSDKRQLQLAERIIA